MTPNEPPTMLPPTPAPLRRRITKVFFVNRQPLPGTLNDFQSHVAAGGRFTLEEHRAGILVSDGVHTDLFPWGMLAKVSYGP